MSKTEVALVIKDAFKDFQKMNNRKYEDVSPSTTPIQGLAEFDSLNGMEITLEIGERLKIEIPDLNICTDKSGKRALTIREITERACELVGAKE